MHAEKLVVGIGINQVALRGQQLQPDQYGENAADEKHQRDGDYVEYSDALVVCRQQPRLPAILRVQIIRTFFSPGIYYRSTHFLPPVGWARLPAGFAAGPVLPG